MVMSPQVSWLFFKAVRAGLAVKRPYLDSYGSIRRRDLMITIAVSKSSLTSPDADTPIRRLADTLLLQLPTS